MPPKYRRATKRLCAAQGVRCVDASVRTAGDLGFSVFVAADACVAFDRIASDGALVKADDTHRVVMANLNQEFATVVDTESVLDAARASLGVLET